jgi:uncharacterized protein (TIGR00369 family)
MTLIEPAGLLKLRERFDDPHPPPSLGSLLGMRGHNATFGTVSFSLDPRPALSNPLGVMHGGVAATMLDAAMGSAVQSTLDETQSYATVELHVHYTRAVPLDGPTVTATGKVVHRGLHIATAEGRVTDAEGRLVAHGTTTCIILETP